MFSEEKKKQPPKTKQNKPKTKNTVKASADLGSRKSVIKREMTPSKQCMFCPGKELSIVQGVL